MDALSFFLDDWSHDVDSITLNYREYSEYLSYVTAF